MRQLTLATGARIVVRRPRRVNTGGIPLVADEMAVGRRLHRLVTVVTRHGADAMIAGRHLHLGLAEMTIGAPTVEVVTGVIVASHHPPPGGIAGAATRYRGPHLVRVRVLRHAERAHGTGTVLVNPTAEEMVHGTDTGTAGVDENMCIHWECLLYVFASCPSVLYVYPRIVENPAPPSGVPPLWHLPKILIWPLSKTPKALSLFPAVRQVVGGGSVPVSA